MQFVMRDVRYVTCKDHHFIFSKMLFEEFRFLAAQSSSGSLVVTVVTVETVVTEVTEVTVVAVVIVVTAVTIQFFFFTKNFFPH